MRIAVAGERLDRGEGVHHTGVRQRVAQSGADLRIELPQIVERLGQRARAQFLDIAAGLTGPISGPCETEDDGVNEGPIVEQEESKGVSRA